ncbi:scabin-related ADP-ribosyltransferase [Actinokineospora globicatena]|uniref:scabin-related ADP-ribosyltransferase n=1 Tax=Actinokineospora globicatena TaxID=103729 RepID=UPI0020A5A4FB|nr:hypothetical protein [Actinokineospora globicatena]MCP2303874.1 hypothetical protein [Actinokineospora globicatena]GLW78968.1 hypothetical protein Aglo01_34500 [Actinokineospora globicatena]GLW86621.1 hypothetical protein Aglo02_42600 [Actinokineospora globicatena]
MPPVAIVATDPSQYGVRRVVSRDVPDWRSEDETLYRGDARSPAEIKAEGGFRPPYMSREGWENNPDWATPDIAKHVGGETNAFVSTSTDRGVGEDFAVSRYLYEINAPGGIYTDPTLHPETGKESHGEGEVLFPGGINWAYVRGWREMRYEPGTGFVAGPFVPNPDYVGDRPAASTSPSHHGSPTAPPPGRPFEPGPHPQANAFHQPTAPLPTGTSHHAPTGPGDRPRQTGDTTRSTNPPPAGYPDQSRRAGDQPQPAGRAGGASTHHHSAAGQPQRYPVDSDPPVSPGQRTIDVQGVPEPRWDFGPGSNQSDPLGTTSHADTSPLPLAGPADPTGTPAPDRPAHSNTDPDQSPATGPRPSLGDRMAAFDDPRLDRLRPHLRSTEGGMSAFAPADEPNAFQRREHHNDLSTAERVPKIPGQFVVDLHGSADSVRVGDAALSPRDLATIIRANPDYDGGPVTLLGCDTGKRPDGFAARLARELGAPVTAPTRDAWVDNNGNVFASSTTRTERGNHAPTWPPNGEWQTFSPDGDQTVHRGPYPPGLRPTWGDDIPTRSPTATRRGSDPTDATRQKLADLRHSWPELDRVLTDNAVTRNNLLSHPNSITLLDAALQDLHTRLETAGITEAIRDDAPTPEVLSKANSITNDLASQYGNEKLTRAQQLAISKEIEAGTTKNGYLQSGFDLSRRNDLTYQQECVDRLRAEAPRVQQQLNQIAIGIAAENDGTASWRKQVKDEARCLKKVREYVDEKKDGDASMLVDVVGAEISFQSVDDLYRALEKLKNDPRVDIVRIKDKVADAAESGNRSIRMNVRVDGHVGELKYTLRSFQAVDSAEHPVYEVRRDLDSTASAEQRPLTCVESLIKAAAETHARREYGAAWNREMACSRLFELLVDHPDVASMARQVVVDSVTNPTGLAKALTDPMTRDATIGTIRELAEGQLLNGRTLDEYRVANPGRGPLFDQVDPSTNSDATGRERKVVLSDEAKRLDPARAAREAPSAQLTDYVRRLHEGVRPAVEAEVRGFVEKITPDSSVSVWTKPAGDIVNAVEEQGVDHASRTGKSTYRAGDVVDAVTARITTSTTHDLARILAAAKNHFGVGDHGRILEINNSYAQPSAVDPGGRHISVATRVDVDGLPYTFELQLYTRRSATAVDLYQCIVVDEGLSKVERERVRQMLAEAAALDQEEAR